MKKLSVLLLVLCLCMPMLGRGRPQNGRNRTHSGNRPDSSAPHGRPHERINDRDWHDHFGREHCFPFHWNGPYLFSNGGYAFIVIEPVPTIWVGEPVFVDYVVFNGYEGYVLCNPIYPGVYVRVSLQ
jgi:hypothetical protein